MRKHLEALGLSLLAVLGLMALFAGGAQAENLKDGGTAGSFTVLGGTSLVAGTGFTGSLEALTGGGPVHSVLLVLDKKVQILCSAGQVTGGAFSSTTQGLAGVEFKECLTFTLPGGEHIPGCVIDDPSNAINDDRIILAHATLLPRLHNGELYVLAEGSPFASILYLKNMGCPLAHLINVSGSVVLRASPVAGSEEKKWLLEGNEAIQKLFQVELAGNPPTIHGDRLLFGALDSYIDANFVINLTGAHLNCSFAIV